MRLGRVGCSGRHGRAVLAPFKLLLHALHGLTRLGLVTLQRQRHFVVSLQARRIGWGLGLCLLRGLLNAVAQRPRLLQHLLRGGLAGTFFGLARAGGGFGAARGVFGGRHAICRCLQALCALYPFCEVLHRLQAVHALAHAVLVCGLGQGLFQVGYMDTTTSLLPAHERGVAGSLVNVTRGLGIVFGAAGISWLNGL